MIKPKFVIITSQYWDEGHIFLCEYNDDFIDRAKRTVEQLEDYKREEGNTKDYYYGDLKYFNENEIRSRYNLNDSGDIYFVMAWSTRDLVEKHKKQLEEAEKYRRGRRGRRAKRIINECDKHHSYKEIARIIEDNFKMVE